MPKFIDKNGNLFRHTHVNTYIAVDGTVKHCDLKGEEIIDKSTGESLDLVKPTKLSPYYSDTAAMSESQLDDYMDKRGQEAFKNSEFYIAKNKTLNNLGI